MSRKRKAPMSPEERIRHALKRRAENLAAFWKPRIDACKTDGELALVAFDRARAAARREQATGDDRAMHDLCVLLINWAIQREEAEWRRHAS